MDKEFKRYMEISEMFSAGMGMSPGMGMDGHMDPERESLHKKLDTLSSTINSVRDNYGKYSEAESAEDKQLYKSILQKHVELMDSLWAKIKSQVGKPPDSEEEKDSEEPDAEKTVIIKTFPHMMGVE